MLNIVKQAKIETEVTHKSGATEVKNETLADVILEGFPAQIEVDMSITKNLGNYESAKLRVALSIPVKPVQKEIEEQYLFAKDYVENKLADLVKELEGGKK